jgi:predicted MFS family arabinose efflux permease
MHGEQPTMKNIQRIYFIRFLSNFCQSIFFPFWAVWLMQEKISTPTEAALTVSLGIFATRLSSLLFSKFVNQYPKKYVLITALAFASIFYSLLYYLFIKNIHAITAWVALSLLIGASLSVTSLSLVSYIATQQNEKNQQTGFSIINIALNLSSGAGPFLAAIILLKNSNIFPLAPIIFSVCSILVCIRLTPDTPTHTNTSEPFHCGGQQYIFFIFLNCLTFIGYAQFYDVFPVYAMQTLNEKSIGSLFIISSIIIVLTQMPITKLMKRRSPLSAMIIANFILAAGTVLFIPGIKSSGYYYCVLGVILISVAETIYAPLYQLLAVQLFKPTNAVLSLAIQSFAWGSAEAIATFSGVYASSHNNSSLALLAGTMAALIVCMLCLYYKQHKPYFVIPTAQMQKTTI